MILEELSKHDDKWRSIAMNITKGNKQLSDDLVQDMYLKLMNYKRFTTGFVTYCMNWMYLDTFKGTEICSLDSLHYINSFDTHFEPTDTEQNILDKADKLDWYAKELLKESYDHSNRQIGEKYNIDYGFVHREVHKAVREVLGDGYKELYKNSNLKHKR